MSIINSSTTHHNQPQERSFANKLFIGLMILVVAAVLIALIAGQQHGLKAAGIANSPEMSKSATVNSTSTVQPISGQPQK